MKYCVLLCGLLLMQAVGLSAKERARLQADDVNISRSGDSVHVSFRLKVERLAKDYILRTAERTLSFTALPFGLLTIQTAT